MAVEIGTAYVSIVASAKGIDKSIQGELGGIEAAAGQTGAALDGMKGKVVAGIAAAGTAIVAFAASGVKEYQNLGIEVGKFADATGISAEQSSRLIEVAGDLGIESETLGGVLNRMLVTAGKSPQTFKDLGVELVRTKDGAVDANATFLAVVDRLNGIKDPAERAEAGTKLLGRGWTSTAELVGLGSSKIQKELDAVADNKVLSDGDVGQARGLRGAFDKIGDAVDELQLSLGKKLAPAVIEGADLLVEMVDAAGPLVDLLGRGLTAAFRALKPLIEDIGGLLTKASVAIEDLAGTDLGPLGDVGSVFGTILDASIPLDNVIGGLTRTFDEDSSAGERLFGVAESLIGSIPGVGEAFSRLGDKIFPTVEAVWGMEESFGEFVRTQTEASDAITLAEIKTQDYNTTLVDAYERQWAAGEAARKEAEDLELSQGAARRAREEQHRLADAAYRVEQKVREQDTAWDLLFGTLDTQEAMANIDREFADMVVNIANAEAAFKSGEIGAEEYYKTVQAENLQAKQDVALYVKDVLGLPAERATQFLAMIDQGNLDAVEQRLGILSRNRTMELSIIAKGGTGKFTVTGINAFASGSRSTPAGWGVAGEDGPELIHFPRGARVYDATETARMIRDFEPAPGGGGAGGALVGQLIMQGTGNTVEDVNRALVLARMS